MSHTEMSVLCLFSPTEGKESFRVCCLLSSPHPEEEILGELTQELRRLNRSTCNHTPLILTGIETKDLGHKVSQINCKDEFVALYETKNRRATIYRFTQSIGWIYSSSEFVSYSELFVKPIERCSISIPISQDSSLLPSINIRDESVRDNHVKLLEEFMRVRGERLKKLENRLGKDSSIESSSPEVSTP
jgi:hypothetical protein